MKHLNLLPALLSITMGFSQEASAFTCFFTLAKDSCWTDYNLSVAVINAATGQTVLTQTVPKGQPFSRQQFTCQPGESFNYSATFTPVFWESDTGKHFPGKRTWSLPQTIAKGDTAWNITVCFPEEFSAVPLPPTASGDCQCQTNTIPPVIAPEKAS